MIEDAPEVFTIDEGETVADRAVETRLMVTDTVVVFEAEELSVTVHLACPVRVVPTVRPVAENVVVAADDESMVIPDPPESHVHAYVYGGVPLDAVTVVLGVVMLAVVSSSVNEAGEADTEKIAETALACPEIPFPIGWRSDACPSKLRARIQ